MQLLNDFSPGLFFIQSAILLILILILRAKAWKPIMGAISDREEGIKNALESAEKAQAEMMALQSKNEDLLKEARAERDSLIQDAKVTATKMIDEAKDSAKTEAEKVLVSAREAINAEKAAAISELKTQVASYAIEIAEKVVLTELSSDDKQKALADKLSEGINLN